ncbi:MAG TPA: DUF481 domain-containing protein [Thermoanaerobaculia bacterium]|nr:DUF481 domain-containing protein [Thermoanaerobaculia bacterium]
MSCRRMSIFAITLLATAVFLMPVESRGQTAPSVPEVTPATTAPAPPPSTWSLSLGLTYSDTRGNSEVEASGGSFSFSGSTAWWTVNTQITTARTSSGDSLLAESYNASLFAMHKLSARLSAGAMVLADRGEPQGIDLRGVGGVGVLWAVVARPERSFNLIAGAGAEAEDFTFGPGSTHPILHLATQGSLQVGPAGKFAHDIGFIFDTEETDNYRVIADASLQAPITHWLALQLTYSLQYDNLPPLPTLKKTDTILAAGLTLTFGSSQKAAPGGSRSGAL